MAKFNQHTWWRISRPDDSASLEGTELFTKGGTAGAALMQETNRTEDAQCWQFFPYDDTYYVLRSKASGPYSYLGALHNDEGDTVPRMANESVADASMLWKVTSWAGGSYFFTNKANGTGYHLEGEDGSPLLTMSSEIKAPQPGQEFLLHQLGSIDDSSYSSVLYPSSVPKPTNKVTPPSTSFPTVTPAASSDSGLSVGARAGIGVTFAVIGIALIVGGCLMWRWRRNMKIQQDQAEAPPLDVHEKYHVNPFDPAGPHEAPTAYQGGYTYRHEKDAQQAPAQLDTVRSPVELGSSPTFVELPAENKLDREAKRS